jgi:DNA-directed RNA polymerase subunit RPC12/RpoP
MFEPNKMIYDCNNCSDEYISKTNYNELFSTLEKD